MRLSFLLLILCMLLPAAAAGSANERSQKQQQLKQLTQRIEQLRRQLEARQNSKSAQARKLRQIEKQIAGLATEMRQTRKAIRQQQKQLDRLQRQKRQIEERIRGHREQLARHIRNAYRQGRNESLKLLFSQDDPSRLQRNLAYYRYLGRQRRQLIEQSRRDFDELVAHERQILELRQTLEHELERQREQKTRLDRDRKQRSRIIAELEQELTRKGRKLTQLEENARNLRQLIDSLDRLLRESPPESRPQQKFGKLRGKLSWPVKGKVRKLFGQRKPPSNLRWQGVLIQAPAGNNVRAIARGRVAFADWLRGYGNLIIIDHGDGYLSLYGHNEALFKQTGEWVEPGDIIGSIGDSGGQKKPALYFEIRRNGKPQNPARWCRSKNWFRNLS
jgi:septal ring factor EnvC (AmiA/AmiB activator)